MIAASSVVGWIIGIVLVLLVFGWVMNSLTKSAQSMRGRRKCTYCGARLKAAAKKFGYADHCSKVRPCPALGRPAGNLSQSIVELRPVQGQDSGDRRR